MLKIQEIKEIIHLIDESSISEFSYEHEGSQVTIKKAVASVKVAETEPNTTVVQQESVKEVPVAPAPQVLDKEKDTVTEATNTDDELTEVVSPMVGTYYSKPTPDSDPYVVLGDNVGKDSVVCIVEAMKLFNEIEADTAGEIVEILVEDGDLVEYGQALFKVRTK